MTPYEKMLYEKERVCCLNCEYLHQEPEKNTAEGIDHINYCKKSGKIILEMHIGVNNIFRKCFKKSSHQVAASDDQTATP